MDEFDFINEEVSSLKELQKEYILELETEGE